MMRGVSCRVIVLAFAGTFLTGCMPKMTVEEFRSMRPERPVELDRLNAFVGNWESTGEGEMYGVEDAGVMETTGSGEVAWDCDGWCLIERSTMNLGEMGDMAMTGVYTWDPKSKKYRVWFFDNWGGVGRGTMTYDEKDETWYVKSKNKSPMGNSVARGTAKVVDHDTMEWTWTEYDSLKLVKYMEAKGTSKRK